MAEKTSISLERATFTDAQDLRKQVCDLMGKSVGWDIVVGVMCHIVNNHKSEFLSESERRYNMAKFKCTVCGVILGSPQEVEEHFKTHQAKEAFTIIE